MPKIGKISRLGRQPDSNTTNAVTHARDFVFTGFFELTLGVSK